MNRKGDISSTLTWVVGFLIIFFMVILFMGASLFIAKSNRNIELEKYSGELSSVNEQLVNFLNSRIFESEIKVYDFIANLDLNGNGDLGYLDRNEDLGLLEKSARKYFEGVYPAKESYTSWLISLEDEQKTANIGRGDCNYRDFNSKLKVGDKNVTLCVLKGVYNE